MAGADSTTAADQLKRIYGTYIDRTQNLTGKFWSLLKASKDDIGGEGWFPALNISQNESYRAITELEALPLARATKFKTGLVQPTIHAATIEISGLAKAIANNKSQAFINLKLKEFQSAFDVFQKGINAECWGDGDGRLATVNGAVAASTTVLVDDSVHLRRGMFVDMFDGVTKDVDNIEITRVNADASPIYTEITLASAQTVADNAHIVLSGHRDVSLTKALLGMGSMFDNSADYIGIDRTTAAAVDNFFAKNITHATDLDEDVLLRAEEQIEREGKEGAEQVIFSEKVQQRAYFNLFKPERRFNDTQTFYGGYKYVMHNDFKWITDVDIDKDKVYLLDLRTIKKFLVEGDIHVSLSGDGLTWRNKAGFDAEASYLILYAQLAGIDPRCNALIQGLNIPTL